MTTLDVVRQRRDDIIAIARKHGATNVRIFGSVLRGWSTRSVQRLRGFLQG